MGTIVLNRMALHEQVCNALRERIMLGEYLPGQHLNIDQLARAMGVSSTPVREALARLISERLVDFQSKRGYSVTPPPDAAWLSDLFDVRALLEPYAARIGAAKGEASVLAEIERLQASIRDLDVDDSRSWPAYLQFNQRFHTIIVDSAGNRPLSEQYKTLSYHTQIGLVYRLGLQDISEVLAEHEPIIAAYRAADGPAAEQALRLHIETGKGRAVAVVAGHFGPEAEAVSAVAEISHGE